MLVNDYEQIPEGIVKLPMRKIIKQEFIIKFVNVSVALSSFQPAYASDVFNFYFQKGGAPATVIQGGGTGVVTPLQNPAPNQMPVQQVDPPAASAPAESLAAESKTSVAALNTAPPHELLQYKEYEIHLGVTRWSDEVGSSSAYSLGGQLNFSRYFGMRAQGHILAVETADYTQPVNNPDQAANRYGGLVAGVFTPIRIELVGHKLASVSVLAGLRTERQFQDTFEQMKTVVKPFYGFSVGLDINENVGIEGSIAFVDGGDIGQATASMAFKF